MSEINPEQYMGFATSTAGAYQFASEWLNYTMSVYGSDECFPTYLIYAWDYDTDEYIPLEEWKGVVRGYFADQTPAV